MQDLTWGVENSGQEGGVVTLVALDTDFIWYSLYAMERCSLYIIALGIWLYIYYECFFCPFCCIQVGKNINISQLYALMTIASYMHQLRIPIPFQQVRAAFEILTLLFAFLYIVILIREIIFQEGLKSVFWGMVRLQC